MPLIRGGLPQPIPVKELASLPAGQANRTLFACVQKGTKDAQLYSVAPDGSTQILSRYGDVTGNDVVIGNDVGKQVEESLAFGQAYEIFVAGTWSVSSGTLNVDFVPTPLLNTAVIGGVRRMTRSNASETITLQPVNVDYLRVLELVSGTDPASGEFFGRISVFYTLPHDFGPNWPLSYFESKFIGARKAAGAYSTTDFLSESFGHLSFNGFGTNPPDVRLRVTGGGSIVLRSMRVRRIA
ncbi:MAG TPA: hypothetical protein VNO22_02880 [Planctomycetota bacterium]|nr:hypothetical protein [Planctomycetota bacterium]